MAFTQKKFLDQAGLEKVLEKFQDYPDNEILGVVINAIQEALDQKAGLDLATQNSNGLMSAIDKTIFDNLNPNMAITLTELNKCIITNAKQANALECILDIYPEEGQQSYTYNLLNVEDTYGNSYISGSGGISNSANDILGPFIAVEPGDVIYYSGRVGKTTAGSINRRLHVYNSNQTWIKQLNFQNINNNATGDARKWVVSGTVPSNGAYIRVSWGSTDTEVMIEKGSHQAYIPYTITELLPHSQTLLYITPDGVIENGQTYTITYPATAGDIYGAQIDVLNGKFYKTMDCIDSYNGESLTGFWLSDRDIYEEGTSPSIGAQVIYTLPTPLEYNITPIEEIILYYQFNEIWCDNGVINTFSYNADTLAVNHLTIKGPNFKINETEVTETDIINWNNNIEAINLKADIESPTFTGTPSAPTPNSSVRNNQLATTSYVYNKMSNFAPIEASNKATKNYDKDEYLFHNGFLYKTLTNIASGTTFSINSNIIQTDVATELKLLFSLINGG